LFEYIPDLYGITIENAKTNLDEQEGRRQLNCKKNQACIVLLNTHDPLLLPDGIDEVGVESIRNTILSDIEELSLRAPGVRFILITRKGDDDFHIRNCQQFEIAPLSDEQIQLF
jgi:hypothetical protein